MKMVNHFFKNPILNAFYLFILFVHLFFLLILFISPQFAFRKKEHKPLIVKTITSKPSIQTPTIAKKNIPATSAPSLSQKQAAPKIEKAKTQPPPSALEKKNPKPPVQREPAIADKTLSKSKTPIIAKKDPPPQNRAKISDSLIKELEESIAKIENKSDKEPVSKRAPIDKKAFAPIILQVDSCVGEDQNAEDTRGDYTDSLVNHLHHFLSLPDYGEVKIQLSLRQDGTVAKLVVLKTQSEKNKQYLEREIPLLRFPCFEGAFASKKEYSFILTFCNE